MGYSTTSKFTSFAKKEPYKNDDNLDFSWDEKSTRSTGEISFHIILDNVATSTSLKATK